MKKRILSAFCLLLFVFALPLTGWTSSVSRDGYFGKIRLSGKVRIVEYNADIKVKVVNAFPDLKVKWLTISRMKLESGSLLNMVRTLRSNSSIVSLILPFSMYLPFRA